MLLILKITLGIAYPLFIKYLSSCILRGIKNLMLEYVIFLVFFIVECGGCRCLQRPEVSDLTEARVRCSPLIVPVPMSRVSRTLVPHRIRCNPSVTSIYSLLEQFLRLPFSFLALTLGFVFAYWDMVSYIAYAALKTLDSASQIMGCRHTPGTHLKPASLAEY